MSLISLPTQFKVSACQLRLSVNTRVSASPFGGSEQAVDLLNDRWLMSVELPPQAAADGRWREAWLASMRGQVNWVALHHFAQPYPAGTARGTILVNGAVAQGASSIAVDGISPSTGTLLAGDLFSAGGQLFMAAADVTASGGAATVSIVNRVRTAISDNAPVTVNKPTALFRLLSSTGVNYTPGLAGGLQLEFGEYIAP